MCHSTTIDHSCSHPDLNYWTVRCAAALHRDPNCRMDPSSFRCEKTSSVWSTPFQCSRCSKPGKTSSLAPVYMEELYEEGMNVDAEDCGDSALDNEELERMDRELDDLDSDQDEHIEDVDIGELFPVQSDSSSYESRKRKMTEDVACEGESEMDHGRAIGPRKRRESTCDGETMRGRTRQRRLSAAPRVGRRTSRPSRRV